MARTSDPGTMASQEAAYREMVIDAYESRQARGITDAKGDEMYRRVMAGQSTGMVTAESRTASAGPTITGVKDRGTGAVAPTYTYARPGKGGDGTYSPSTMAPKRSTGPTPKQESYLRALLTERAHPWKTADMVAKLDAGTVTFAQAKEAITKLLTYSRKPRMSDAVTALENSAPVQPSAPKVNAWQEWRTLATPLLPFERFATTGKDGQTKFWRVFEYTRKSDNRTFTILRTVSGASGEQGHWTEKMAPEAMVSVAKQIHAAGIKESAKRYGVETERCSDCNRLLTDETSRANGIGPICAAKDHWA